MVVGSKIAHTSPDVSSITIGDATVDAVESARTIGVVMDITLAMAMQVSSVCKSDYSHCTILLKSGDT